MAKFNLKRSKKSKSEGKIAHKKTTIDNITFDSKMEAQYYEHLKEEKKKGNVLSFELQPVFELLPKHFVLNQETITCTNPRWTEYDKIRKQYNKANPNRKINISQPMRYISDFKVTYKDKTIKVIDVKGIKTADFKLKEKLFNFSYPEYENLLCVTWDNPSNAWLSYDEYLKAKRERKKKSK